MRRLLTIMRRLRGPGGCPWDREQDHRSLRPYLLEEAAEAVDAISEGEPAAMAEELGDVLLQVAFHAVIAEEAGTFDYEAVETAIVDKLVRRHPHVFGAVKAETSGQVLKNWQALKAQEKGPGSGVPSGLPALMRAQELGKRMNWPEGSGKAVHEAAQALKGDLKGDARLPAGQAQEAVAGLLMAVVDYARSLEVNAELALREALRLREKRSGSA